MSIKNKGFTLIEILIVILIIGITIGFALIAFGDFGASKRTWFAVEQLATTIKMAQQESLLEGNTLELHIDKTGYQLLQLSSDNRWQPITQKGIKKTWYFPENSYVRIKSGTTISQDAHIIMTPSGTTTPFTLELGTNPNELVGILTVSGYGVINIRKPL